ARVVLSGEGTDATWSDEEGTYLFADLDSADYVVRPEKVGDLARAITALDASFALRYSAELLALDGYQRLAGDVSGDSTVSAYDASCIMRWVVGLDERFPVGADWRFVPASFAVNTTNWIEAPDSLGYFPLDSTRTEEDFLGLVYGDLTGNWRPNAPGPPLVARNAAVPPREVRLSDVWGERGEVVAVPVVLDDGRGVFGLTATVGYDPAVLEVVEVAPGEGRVGMIAAYRDLGDGRVRLAVAGPEPLGEGGAMVMVRFRVRRALDRNGTGRALTLEDVVLNEGELPVVVRSARFVASRPEEFALEGNAPNPFNPMTELRVQVPRAVHVRLEVYDILGRRVRVLVDEKREAGYYAVRWDGRDEAGVEVGSGMYLCRMAAGSFCKVRKMVLLK
ncbi:MAG: hypothetical protein KAR36_01925, partial [Candidatus Latescibacteria bacterium]|nr:hypothetical protein [Candidatus Latescibacterota bacterium]